MNSLDVLFWVFIACLLIGGVLWVLDALYNETAISYTFNSVTNVLVAGA